MKDIKFYEFSDCNTCKKALKFLSNRRYPVERVDIFAHPPSKAEIRKMIAHYRGDFRKLLTPAAKRTQDLALPDKTASLSEAEFVDLLASDGKLFKRPFVLTETVGLVGFDETLWDKHFPK